MDEMEDLKKTLNTVSNDVYQIKVALIGVKDYKQPGLIDKVNEIERSIISHDLNVKSGFKAHRDRIEKLEKTDFKRNAIIGAISGTVGVLGGAGLHKWLVRLFN